MTMDHIVNKGTVILNRDQYAWEIHQSIHCYHAFTAAHTHTSKGKKSTGRNLIELIIKR